MRPGPGEELNPRGNVTVPRLAATVILLRGGDERLEVLLVRRNPEARFMGGAWVFPGGAVNASDRKGEDSLKSAALRELAEEAGITVASSALLVPFARWITPAQVRIRFDTWFFLAPSPPGAEPVVDGAEIVDSRWLTPAAALAAARAGRLLLVFPTIKQLEQLASFASATQLIEHARGLHITPVEPRVITSGEAPRIVLPGDAGYD